VRDSGRHHFVNRDGWPPAGRSLVIRLYVLSDAGNRQAILNHCEHDERGDADKHGGTAHKTIIWFRWRIDRTGGAARAYLLLGIAQENPMHIRDVMTPNPRTVTPDDPIQNAARIMRDEDTGAVPVVDNGRTVGMVTDRDIVVRAVADGGQPDRPVRDIVTSAVVTATPDMSTREAAQLMSEHQIRRLPVVEGERLVGIVSLGDIAVKEGKDSRSGDTLQSISEGVKERG
jgi:CBS domain-containing protein